MYTTIAWIPGHAGNETADKLAKDGASISNDATCKTVHEIHHEYGIIDTRRPLGSGKGESQLRLRRP
jgi:hypothetical protein